VVDADSTPHGTIPIEDCDATIMFEAMPVDPFVDLWLRHRGRASRRRFLNMAERRRLKMWRDEGLSLSQIQDLRKQYGPITDAKIRAYVREAISPGYSIAFK